jgi:hypothetical protein
LWDGLALPHETLHQLRELADRGAESRPDAGEAIEAKVAAVVDKYFGETDALFGQRTDAFTGW